MSGERVPMGTSPFRSDGSAWIDAIPSPELLEAFPQAAVVVDLEGTILAWNHAATVLYGYTKSEALGRPSREVINAPDSEAETAEVWRHLRRGAAWSGDRSVRRADGRLFVARAQLIVLRSGAGMPVAVLVLSEDVSAERAAAAALGVATARLAVLAELSLALSSSLDLDVVLRRLAELMIRDLADLCIVDLSDDLMGERLAAVAARSRRHRELFEQAEAHLPRRRNPTSSLSRTMASGAPTLVSVADVAYLRDNTPDAPTEALYEQLGLTSVLVVPLVARSRLLGAITFLRIDDPAGTEPRHYDEADVEVASEIARHAAVSVDNARLYTAERRVAETLQRQLPPDITPGPDLLAAARYMPASAGVGGDWYDLFEIPGGATGVAIGDVMGHDMHAAASMGQLRSVVRSYGFEGAPPAEVLDRADRLVQTFNMAQLATAFFAGMVRNGSDWTVTYANAGHPAPLARLPDGSVLALDGAAQHLIGVDHVESRPEEVMTLPCGTLLLLFTDGLTDRRRASIDESTAQLVTLLQSSDGTPDDLCDRISAEMAADDHSDDIALLAILLS